MQARIPTTAERTMSAYLSQVEVVRRAMSGATTLAALDRAEEAIDRMPSKAELRMAVRAAKAACRANRPLTPAADPLAIPTMPAVA